MPKVTKQSNKTAQSPAPQTVEQTIGVAWEHLGAGRAREAEKLCAQLLKTFPDHAHAWFLRGVAAAALGKPKLALKYYDAVQKAPDLLPSVAQARGRAWLALNEPDAAIDCFQEALLYRADDANLYYLLGLAKLRQSQPDEARRFMRQCSLLDPSFGPAHYELGVMALGSGDGTKAVGHFAAAVRHLPESPEAANNLGLSQQMTGDLAAAERSYRAALALNERYAEAWFNLGQTLRALGAADAEDAVAKALALNPALKDALVHAQ